MACLVRSLFATLVVRVIIISLGQRSNHGNGSSTSTNEGADALSQKEPKRPREASADEPTPLRDDVSAEDDRPWWVQHDEYEGKFYAQIWHRTGQRSTFVPSYQWRRKPEFEALAWSGLEINLRRNEVRIMDPFLAVMHIPSLERTVRVQAPRHATIEIITASLVAGGARNTTWPGRRNREFVLPDPSTLSLVYKGKVINPNATVEEVGLYYMNGDIEVHISESPGNTDGLSQGTSSDAEYDDEMRNGCGCDGSEPTLSETYVGEQQQEQQEKEEKEERYEEEEKTLLDQLKAALGCTSGEAGVAEHALTVRKRTATPEASRTVTWYLHRIGPWRFA